MGDRIFSLVTSLLCNGYVVRVQRPNNGLHEYDISDYETSDEAEVLSTSTLLWFTLTSHSRARPRSSLSTPKVCPYP